MKAEREGDSVRMVEQADLEMPLAQLPRKRRAREHQMLAATFNVRCRECGTDNDILHVHDLVVHCEACCPACGGSQKGA